MYSSYGDNKLADTKYANTANEILLTSRCTIACTRLLYTRSRRNCYVMESFLQFCVENCRMSNCRGKRG